MLSFNINYANSFATDARTIYSFSIKRYFAYRFRLPQYDANQNFLEGRGSSNCEILDHMLKLSPKCSKRVENGGMFLNGRVLNKNFLVYESILIVHSLKSN